MNKHFFLLLCSGLVLLNSCTREEIDLITDTPTTGYRVEGKVFDRLRTPVPDVSIYATFALDPDLSSEPVPNTYTVTAKSDTVRVWVEDRAGSHVRLILAARQEPGTYPILWDGKNDAGTRVPINIYIVKVTVNAQKQFEKQVLNNGEFISLTDSTGTFNLDDNDLPIGETPVAEWNQYTRSFIGRYSIMPIMTLYFYKNPVTVERTLSLRKNRVEYVEVIM